MSLLLLEQALKKFFKYHHFGFEAAAAYGEMYGNIPCRSLENILKVKTVWCTR